MADPETIVIALRLDRKDAGFLMDLTRLIGANDAAMRVGDTGTVLDEDGNKLGTWEVTAGLD